MEELDEAERLTKAEYVRRHAYITILRARAYFAQKRFEMATELALEALPVCLAIQSESNIADLGRLCDQLSHTTFRNAPSLTQLEMLLKTRKR